MKKHPIFQGKILNLDRKINSSFPVKEKIFTFIKRKIDFAKHFSTDTIFGIERTGNTYLIHILNIARSPGFGGVFVS